MTTYIQALADVFQKLPPRWRAGLYLAFGAVGLVLAVLQTRNVGSVFGVPTEDALAYYTLLTPIFGTYAAVNTKQRRHHEQAPDGDEGDMDLSSFEPVGDAEAVYA
jgi:hypothetical protein